MLSRIERVALPAVFLLVGGCGTAVSVGENDPYPNIVYGGVRDDLGPHGCAPGPGPGYLLDVPFSAVADTIALPYTIPRSIYNARHPGDAPPPRAGFDPESWHAPHRMPG